MRGDPEFRKQSVNLVLTVLEIVTPVFALAAVGFAWVKLGFEYRIEFITRFAMTLAVPCLVFVALMKAQIDPNALTALTLAAFSAYAIVAVIFFGMCRLAKLDVRTYLNPLIFGNTGNMGLPLAFFAFGQAGLSYAVVVFAVMAVLSFSVGVWLVSGGGSLLKVIKEPLVGATILGGLFLSQGWSTPSALTNSLELIGQMAIPMMLITLGVAVARLKPNHVGKAVWISIAKLVVCTGAAWGVGRAMNLPAEAFAVLVVQIANPVPVTSYLLAEKYGADSDAVAGLVVISTLISVGTIPLTLAFLI